MILEFNNKSELEKIVESLDENINAGFVTLKEISSGADTPVEIKDPDQPGHVNQFFSTNYQHISAILNLIAEPIFIKDQNSCWLFMNQAFCNFFGIDHRDLLGKTSKYLFSKQQSEVFEKQDAYVLETGNDSLVEDTITDNLGKERNLVIRKKIFTGQNNQHYIVGSFYELDGRRRSVVSATGEISVPEIKEKEYTQLLTQTINKLQSEIVQRRKIEISLQESEEKFRSVIEQSLDGFVLGDTDGRIVEWNKRMFDITGIRREDALGKLLWDVEYAMMKPKLKNDPYYDKVKARYKNALQKLKTESIEQYLEGHIMNADGIDRYVHVALFEIKTSKEFYIGSIVRDITDQKHSEKTKAATFKISQLIQTDSKLETLYEPIHNIISELMNAGNFYIALYDDENNLLTFPYYADEQHEKPESGPLKRDLNEYVIRHGKPVFANREWVDEHVKSNELDPGTVPFYDWIGIPLITQKKVIGLIAVQSYSPEKGHNNHDKDILVYFSEQIALLIFKKQAEEQILSSKDIAEESDRLKTAFIANMSHELRTPMTGIIGFASILAQKATDKETKTMLEYVLASSNRLMSTLNTILELSQLESGRHPIETMQADVNGFIDFCLEPHVAEAAKKELLIEKELENNAIATFNNNFLRQILSNLFSNAIKFTERGTITIRSGMMDYQEERYAYVAVNDTGIGIEEKHFTLIFENFRQVSEGMNRTFEGSGLGLSLCKKMAEMMGGHILVESKPGVGSTFTLLLPVEGIPAVKKTKKAVEKQPPATEEVKRSKPKVLVVDDNNINAELMEAFLKNNYEVHITNTGASAVEMAKNENFDAILMDINLGEGINGIEATLEIRKLDIKTPVIAVTAFATEKDMKENMAGYFINYILKPVDKNSLIDILEDSMQF